MTDQSLETRTVSRKTPRDGRLEITKPIALRLQQAAGDGEIAVDVDGEPGAARIDTYECTCRGPDARHVHYFLQSELFKALVPESRVELAWMPGEERLRASTERA